MILFQYIKNFMIIKTKINILIKLCKKYDRVVFVDDDRKNVNAARNLNIKNLKVIKACE